jgi:hypothetical protein
MQQFFPSPWLRNSSFRSVAVLTRKAKQSERSRDIPDRCDESVKYRQHGALGRCVGPNPALFAPVWPVSIANCFRRAASAMVHGMDDFLLSEAAVRPATIPVLLDICNVLVWCDDVDRRALHLFLRPEIGGRPILVGRALTDFGLLTFPVLIHACARIRRIESLVDL